MKLIDLLVKELPKRGGWPEGAGCAIQDADMQVCFSEVIDELTINSAGTDWLNGAWFGGWSNPYMDTLSEDHTTAIITREQYESALASSEGWIEWGGGECPVHESANVDIKLEDGSEKSDAPACSFIWQHSEDVYAIIAYRLHRDINSRTKDDLMEQDLNECIGASEAQVWNGDGVPPIGCACEMQDSKGTWLPVEIIAKNDGFTFGWSYDYRIVLFGDKADEFRPLRAEEENVRDSAVDAMQDYFPRGGWDYDDICSLYDAIAEGKIPGVKLSQAKKYNIGDATMRMLFTPFKIENVSDMQLVFDAMEKVLSDAGSK